MGVSVIMSNKDMIQKLTLGVDDIQEVCIES